MEAPEERLGAICLRLPEATEKQAWGDPTWRVRDRIFAMLKRGDGRPSVWLKAPEGAQEVLIGADPERFFRPPYVGHKGWVGIRLDAGAAGRPDLDEVARQVRRSYRLVAPRRLAEQFPTDATFSTWPGTHVASNWTEPWRASIARVALPDGCMARIGTLFIIAAMRTGYAARGVLYGMVGILSLAASAGGGPAPGLVGTVQRLGQLTWHKPVLFALALGLVLYAVWRGLDAMLDLAGHGRGFGWVERFGLFFVATLYLVFASYAARLAIGGAYAPGSGGRLSAVVGELVAHPAGRWFVVLVGIGTISFGSYSVWKGISGQYRSHLRPTRLLARVIPLISFGLVARGAVFWVMGGFIAWAGWNQQPLAAGGFGDALGHIRSVYYGRTLLALVGIGIVAFSFYCFIEASHRVLPRAERASGR